MNHQQPLVTIVLLTLGVIPWLIGLGCFLMGKKYLSFFLFTPGYFFLIVLAIFAVPFPVTDTIFSSILLWIGVSAVLAIITLLLMKKLGVTPWTST